MSLFFLALLFLALVFSAIRRTTSDWQLRVCEVVNNSLNVVSDVIVLLNTATSGQLRLMCPDRVPLRTSDSGQSHVVKLMLWSAGDTTAQRPSLHRFNVHRKLSR